MKKKFLILLLSVFSIGTALGQGDICALATDLGTLPAPAPCPGGAGTTFTYNGTTTGATAENPYSSLACMDAPAADVWVSFVASGNEMTFDFTSGLNDANVGIYTGDCNNLVGLFCESSNNGNISATLSPFTPGETYYMQISGADATDFDDFSIDMTNFMNCDLCLLASNITANPAPTNGYYLPGTTVDFCLEITEFTQVSANWLHGVLPSFGGAWDLTTLTPVSAPNASGAYDWIWVDPPGADPLGWYVDDDPNGPATGDGNPTNNFGDLGVSGTGSWTFCWSITTDAACTPGGDLSMSVNTTADGESGGWGSVACTGDPDVPFQAAMICCDVPLTTFIDESCPGAFNGSGTVLGQGGQAPYDYVWEDSGGGVVYTDNNNNGVSAFGGMTSGTYTITVTDDNGCEQIVDITISSSGCPIPTFVPEPANVTVQCIGDVPAMTNLTWNDVCAGTGSVAGTDAALAGNACGGTITRTWTYTNPCGNNVTATQVITINDNIDPVMAAPPANVTVQCIGDVPAMTNLGYTDNCDASGTVAGTDGALAGGSCGGTITRTWTWTDACGNTSTPVTQTITVNDNIAPVMAAPPANVTVQCIGDVPAMTNLGYTDNCDASGMVAGTDGALVGTNCGGTITRTWTWTDACGNVSAPVTQTITVNDNIAPVMAAPPAAIAVQCAGDVPAMTNLGYTDNCDAPGSVAGSDVSDGLSCPETITRTWTYTDACGNVASSATQTITIEDTQVPVFAAPPADVTVECIGDVPAMTDLGWTDNCDGAANATGVDGALSGGPCGGTITRTWTYTDACGNNSTVTQTITVDDTTPPTASNPAPQVGVPPVFDPTQVTDEADNCTVNPTVTDGGDVSDGGNCPEIITRTYIITDDCGNTSTVTQTFTIGDAVLPTASNPTPMNVECIGDVLGTDPTVVTDEADNGAVPTVAWEDDTSDGLSCPETILRRYRVTDDCGNFIFVTQTITVMDVTAPVMDAPLAAVAVQCIGDVPAMTDLGYTDNCDIAGVVTGTDVSDGLTCPETITRSWFHTDACGNVSATVTQIITVHDTQVPVIAGIPAAIAVECIGDVPAMIDLGYTDNCDAPGTVTGADVSDGLTCPETITRTWTYTDACGNVATETQIITVQDTQVPVFAAPPAAIAVECVGDVPVMTDLGWTDNCDGAGTVTGVDGALTDPCGGTITRTWTYTDACGNVATVTQTITVDDTTLPTASNPAPQVGLPPVFDPTQVTDEADNCGVPTVTDGGDVSDGGNCPEIITRTYIITDACGNFITVEQTFTIGDLILPSASNPLPTNVECIGDVPATDPTVVTDEADNGALPTVTWEDDTSDGLSCPETILRRYRVTDDCGNFIFVTQTITVMDVTAPVMDAPLAAVAVQCAGDVPAMTDLGYTDNCDAAGVVTGSDMSDGLTCPETITRSWFHTDACGNVSATVTQTITVHDTQAPVIAGTPAAVAVECIGDVPAMIDLGYTDNCDAPGMVTGADVSDGLTCPETITRTWTYTDACGNVATETQTITVQDTQVPVFAAPPADLTVECVGDIPAMTDLGWTDNCDGAGTVTGVDGALTDPCGGTITRTWTYTDACGNVATVTQTITVDDTTPPTATDPATTIVPGGPVPPVDPTVVNDEADNCTVNPVVVLVSEVSDNNPCPETITRIYSVTDDCGNTINVTHLILITDPFLPTASNPLPINVECIGDVPAADVLVVTDEADNQGVPVVAFVSDVSDGLTCPETITRTYSVTDLCGGQILVTQTITVLDVTNPTASAPATVNVECIGDVPGQNILDIIDEADNCTVNPVVAFVGDVSDGLTCPETITRTYSITDDCGNQITVDQLIIVNDVTNPTGTAPATVNVECIGDVPANDPLLILDEADNCTVNPVVVFVGDVSDGLTCPETITRTYSITDDCGNQITVDQLIIVNDITLPTASNPVTTTVPGGPVPAVDITVVIDEADNCTVNPVVAFVSEVSDNNPCPETITRIYSVTDDCGNTINVTHLIVITDPILPTGTAPATVNVECIGDVPANDPLLIIDEADNQGVPVVAFVSDVSDGLSCPETITRTYSITDVCGNEVLVTQLIIVNDLTNPTASAPATVNVECIGDVPAANILDVNDEADNCTVNPVVAFVGDVSDGLTCPETITRTYSITDDCGNQITVDQLIIVNDVTNPTGTAPATVNVECIGDVPANDPLLITNEADNCTVNPVVAFVGDVSDGLTCPETITRTYSITDDCGNQITVDQLIIVNDVTNPTASNPAGVVVELITQVPAANPLVVIDEADNCTVNPVVAFVSDVSDGLACPETITRTYSITDDCGNQITVTQTIVVSDITLPTASNPVTVNVECIGDVPAADILVVTDEADNSGVAVVAFVGDVSDGLSCPETITRTYSVTDDCGNQITVDQLIIVNDVTNPTASNPVTVNVECIGDVPATDILVVTDEADNCTVVPVVAFVGDVSDGLTCPETITRTYSITDDCGNVTTVDQLIIVNDVTNPTGTAPITVNVECIGDVPANDPLLITNEADNCTVNPVVAFVGDVSDGLSCPETITRTYSITDDCGNQITVDQLIIVNDVTNPTASNPIPISVPGSMDVPAPDPLVVIDELDNCTANPVVAWVSDVSDGNVCNLEKITRTYSVTDDCGNQILVTQEITILAVPAPIDAGPDQIICQGASAAVVADNPWNVSILWDPLGPNGSVSPAQTTTYTVTADNLGCISTDDMTVFVEELPLVSFIGDVLQGCEPLTVSFTNTSTTSSSLVDCYWEFSDGSSANGCGIVSHTFQNGGLYDVTLTTTSENGCINTITYDDYVYVENVPVAAFTPSQTELTNIFTEVEFTNNSVDATDYSWTFGDNSASTSVENPTHIFPNEEGGYYLVELVALSPLGCSDTAYATIHISEEVIYYVPNTFTPDGDSYNEYFKPIFTSGYDPFDFDLFIFNRWGEIIWESHDASVGWDGTYGQGQKLVQDGTYTWRIEFKTTETDERILVTGHVNVIR